MNDFPVVWSWLRRHLPPRKEGIGDISQLFPMPRLRPAPQAKRNPVALADASADLTDSFTSREAALRAVRRPKEEMFAWTRHSSGVNEAFDATPFDALNVYFAPILLASKHGRTRAAK